MKLSVSTTEVIARLSVSGSIVAATSPLEPWLPPLSDDSFGPLDRFRVAGQVARELRSGKYEPAETMSVAVPKRTSGTRTVTLLALTDRVVYESLVHSVSPLLERALSGPEVVFGSRTRSRALRWLSFERALLRVEPKWVVMADAADCSVNVSHRLATEALRHAGACASADALEELLGKLMKRDTGLPENLEASAVLASQAVSRVDKAMLRRGWNYARCSDDFRIAAATREETQRAIAELEEELLAVDLRLRPEKSEVLRLEDYKRRLNIGSPWENWMWDHVAPLVEGSLAHRRMARIGDAGLRQMRATDRGVMKATRELGEILNGHVQHGRESERVRRALKVLAAARTPALLEEATQILGRYPAETEMVAKWLRGLTHTDQWREAIEQVEGALATNRTSLASQRAWLFWVLQPVAERLSSRLVGLVREAVDREDWICRLQAARLLVLRKELGPEVRFRLQSTAPPPLRASLAAYLSTPLAVP